MTTNIYILKLKQGKYYVGKSENPYKRFDDHVTGNGSVWTKKYEPLEIERVINNASDFDEDRWVKEYMNMHGVENVRGGSYSAEILTVEQIHSCQTEIWGASDLCFRCGGTHFIKDCPRAMEEKTSDCGYFQPLISWFTSITAKEPKKGMCSRCGRNNHSAKSCYASTDVEGQHLAQRQKCYRCGRTNHIIKDCYAKTDVSGKYIVIE